jgi:hypothetical protein
MRSERVFTRNPHHCFKIASQPKQSCRELILVILVSQSLKCMRKAVGFFLEWTAQLSGRPGLSSSIGPNLYSETWCNFFATQDYLATSMRALIKGTAAMQTVGASIALLWHSNDSNASTYM